MKKIFSKWLPYAAASVMMAQTVQASLIPIGANQNCASCQVQSRERAVSQSPTNASIESGINVADLLKRSLVGVQYSAPVADSRSSGVPEWVGGLGERPGAFQRPWTFESLYGPSNFDPSFVTSYYTEKTGPINDPSAPWNRFLPQALAAQYYQFGMTLLGLPPVVPSQAQHPGI